jgi:hypothetical protein
VAIDGTILGTFTEYGPNAGILFDQLVTPWLFAPPGNSLSGRHVLQITSLVAASKQFSLDRVACT